MNKQIATLVLALAAAAPALAAPETYVVEGSHTYPRFSYSHFGYSTQLSRFNKTTGKIVFDKAAKTGSVDIVIDTTSVDTGFATFNEHIQGDDFLATGTLPEANGDGIANVATVERLDYSSQSNLGAKLGPVNLSLDGARTKRASV